MVRRLIKPDCVLPDGSPPPGPLGPSGRGGIAAPLERASAGARAIGLLGQGHGIIGVGGAVIG
jgi:hypothetical protein